MSCNSVLRPAAWGGYRLRTRFRVMRTDGLYIQLVTMFVVLQCSRSTQVLPPQPCVRWHSRIECISSSSIRIPIFRRNRTRKQPALAFDARTRSLHIGLEWFIWKNQSPDSEGRNPNSLTPNPASDPPRAIMLNSLDPDPTTRRLPSRRLLNSPPKQNVPSWKNDMGTLNTPNS